MWNITKMLCIYRLMEQKISDGTETKGGAHYWFDPSFPQPYPLISRNHQRERERERDTGACRQRPPRREEGGGRRRHAGGGGQRDAKREEDAADHAGGGGATRSGEGGGCRRPCWWLWIRLTRKGGQDEALDLCHRQSSCELTTRRWRWTGCRYDWPWWGRPPDIVVCPCCHLHLHLTSLVSLCRSLYFGDRNRRRQRWALLRILVML